MILTDHFTGQPIQDMIAHGLAFCFWTNYKVSFFIFRTDSADTVAFSELMSWDSQKLSVREMLFVLFYCSVFPQFRDRCFGTHLVNPDMDLIGSAHTFMQYNAGISRRRGTEMRVDEGNVQDQDFDMDEIFDPVDPDLTYLRPEEYLEESDDRYAANYLDYS